MNLWTLVACTPAIPLALRSLVTNPPSDLASPAAESPCSASQAEQTNWAWTTEQQTVEQQKHGIVIQMTMQAALRPLAAYAPVAASTSGWLLSWCLL